MKTKLITIAILGAIASSSALAWGDREQGLLAGIAGTLFLQHLSRQSQAPQSPVYQPPVQAPPPQIVYVPSCRQVLAIEIDRYGNEYRRPVTVCNQ